MKKLKVILILLLIILTGLTVASEVYQRTQLDTTAPALTCDEQVLEVSVEAEEADLLQGVSAWDNRDGDITSEIMVDHISTLVTADTARITYVVFDQAGNTAKLTRTIRYTDYEAPHFELTKPLRYTVGQTVTVLDRLSAQDVVDGEITDNIRMTSQNLNNGMEGIYSVTFQVTNSLGDTAVLPISVIIESSGRLPEIQLREYLLYLNQGDDFRPENYLGRTTDGSSAVRPDEVEITSEVDTSTPGVYQVLYQYTGSNGTGRAILTVVVE